MRIITAREQVEMLAPWRTAGWQLEPHQSAQIDQDNPDLTALADIPEHNGRWSFPYQGAEGPSEYQSARYHKWNVEPTDAPAVYEGKSHGRKNKVFYNPALTQVTDGEFRPQLSNNGNKVEDLAAGADPNTIWRGMSHEELEAAKKNGYFQTNGSYNLGEQTGTLFGKDPSIGQSYANSYAPYQFKPTFTRPAHVVGIPNRNYPVNSTGEYEVPGRIPLGEVTHHYRGDVVSISPGSYNGYQGSPNPDYGFNGFDNQPSRSLSPGVTVHWSPGELHRGNRLARLAAAFDPMKVTNRLKGEFSDWFDSLPEHRLNELRNIEMHPFMDHHENNPVSHWPTVERFLKDKYPAAHRGFMTGREDASMWLDDPNNEYEDPMLEGDDEFGSMGPPEPYSSADYQKLGYDPQEVAAGMVLLHNRAHSGRQDSYLNTDKKRLVDIYNKRQQMQRNYEQRQVGA